jgi:hypothetical protein
MNLLVLIGLWVFVDDSDGPQTLYVQLIRGEDAAIRPSPESKPIGPKLSGKLSRCFRFQNYWEMNRKAITASPGKIIRVALNQTRAVEIDLTDRNNKRILAYKDGKPMGVTSIAANLGMAITGGDRGDNSAWFIVVRQDKPSVH